MGSIFNDFISPISKNNNNSSPSGNIASLSPYLNFDPNYIPKLQPEYLYSDENYNTQTSKRTSVALPQIGVCCITGAGLGGFAGFYNGIKATTLAGQTGKIRRTQIINYMTKQGSATSCTLGIIASFYSVIGVLLSYARDKDDTYNTFISAGLTGMLYKSTSGLKTTGLGAAVGVGIAGVYTLLTSADDQKVWGKFKHMPL